MKQMKIIAFMIYWKQYTEYQNISQRYKQIKFFSQKIIPCLNQNIHIYILGPSKKIFENHLIYTKFNSNLSSNLFLRPSWVHFRLQSRSRSSMGSSHYSHYLRCGSLDERSLPTCSSFTGNHMQIKTKISFFLCQVEQNINLYFIISPTLMNLFKPLPSQFKTLFDVHNIKAGKSQQIVEAWGNIDCLQMLLNTSLTKGICDNKQQLALRVNTFGHNKSLMLQPTLWSLLFRSFATKNHCFIYAILLLHILYGMVENNLTTQLNQMKKLGLIMLISSILQLSCMYYINSNNLLATSQSKKVKIVRKGKQQQVNEDQLLVGDLLKIAHGHQINVNGILIENKQISIYHPLITNNKPTFILSGSSVLAGQGTLVVCNVGERISKQIGQIKDETGSQHILNKIFNKIEQIGWKIVMVAIAFRFIHSLYYDQVPKITCKVIFQTLCVSLIIKAITISDPLVIFKPFSYIYSINQMNSQHLLPLTLYAAQAIGLVDDICVNKTGLLTVNQMKVKQFFCQNKNNSFQARQELHNETIRMICLSICNNSTACPDFKIQNQILKATYIGNQLQCALLQASYQLGFDYHKFRQINKQTKVFQFQSHRKMMATVYKDDNNSLFVFVKGAPEILLPYCINFINEEGLQSQISTQSFDNLYQIVEDYGAKSLHTVLLAFKPVESMPNDWEDICHSLVVLSIFGVKDTLRKNTLQAANMLSNAGINLRMVTSDNKMTAISVAKEAGILSKDWMETDEDCTVMQGKQFRQFVGGIVNQGTVNETLADIDNFKIVQRQLRVLVRSTPQDKYLLLVGLRILGKKAAITINNKDEMSMKCAMKADIVITNSKNNSNGQTVTKSVLLKQNDLISIAGGVKWSRMMVSSLQKMAKFQANMVIVTLSMILIGVLIYGEPPLRLFQIIWTHLILSFFVGIALVVKIPSKTACQKIALQQISTQLCAFVVIQAMVQVLKLCFYLFEGPQFLGILPSFPSYEGKNKKHETIFFNIFVMTQIFSSFSACQSNHPFQLRTFLNNRLLLIFILTSIVLQLLIIKIGSEELGIAELSFKENVFCILIGMGSLFPCFGSELLENGVKKFCSYLIN